jgi:hypothetical protein
VITFLALLAVIGAFIFGLRLAATFDVKKALAHRNLVRDATPPHYQGREAEFDEHGRPW